MRRLLPQPARCATVLDRPRRRHVTTAAVIKDRAAPQQLRPGTADTCWPHRTALRAGGAAAAARQRLHVNRLHAVAMGSSCIQCCLALLRLLLEQRQLLLQLQQLQL